MEPNALVIMFKVPEPGTVKTRLVPPLSYEEASGLYTCFLEDIFEKVSRLRDVRLYAAYTPEWAAEKVAGIMPDTIEAFAQDGVDLGERMYNAFLKLFEKGHKKVSLIGSDSPDMPMEFIEESFRLLDAARVVLGPAADGGYYLIAMNELMAAPFINMRWSNDAVFKETVRRLEEKSVRYESLKPWHDIDRVEDLPLLKENNAAPRSYEFLKALRILL